MDVAIIGFGTRGQYYAYLFKKRNVNVVAVCDSDLQKLQIAKNKYSVAGDRLFADEKEFFGKGKMADLLVVSTQDADHYGHAVQGLEIGYDLLLEKPIASDLKECIEIRDMSIRLNRKIFVCHVLRYAPFFTSLKKELDSGKFGKVVTINMTENVSYWHQAHSFVRGNWRNEDETCSMIMQKCCHDLDIIHYYVNSPCKTVYSTGDLSFFNKKNQPTDAADRCADCKLKNSCPYSAENIYIGRWLAENKPENVWPFNIVDSHVPLTEESIRNAYTNNQYGRCVFACDNNVVDNQFVNMVFENGVKANLTMTAFTNWLGRKMVLHGTAGEIELNENQRTIRVAVFGKEEEFIDLDRLVENDFFQHGGGDNNILNELYAMMENSADKANSLEDSAESHFMAIAAEKSRKSHTVVAVHDDE